MNTRRYAWTGAKAAALSAFAALLLRGQVSLDPPILTSSNTVHLVVNGPTTNIRHGVYFTNGGDSSFIPFSDFKPTTRK